MKTQLNQIIISISSTSRIYMNMERKKITCNINFKLAKKKEIKQIETQAPTPY